jgi:hypothetical protein
LWIFLAAPARAKPIGDSFYPAAYFEKGLVAIQPTKKFCEIAAIPVSPSYRLG